jgi:hypothetical protein
MFLLFLAQAISTPVAGMPAFDTKAYCRKISDTVGGSYQIEETCRDQEARAISKLNSIEIPGRILRYCTKIGETIGGSYQIMETCVEQELASAARLERG